MTRIIHLGADNLSNRLPLGADTGAGSHGEGTQTYPHAENVIQFPSRFLPDSQDSGPEPFILSFDIREIGALFLVGALAFVMLAGFASIVFLYLTLVS